MNPEIPCLTSPQRLRQFIHTTLCNIGQLEPTQFPLTERNLTRSGAPCGVLFSVHGPRQIKLTAVWDSINNEIYLYDSSGNRYQQIQVSPVPAQAAA